MRPPFTLSGGGSLSVFRTAEDLEGYVEMTDYENGEYRIFDRDAQVLGLVLDVPHVVLGVRIAGERCRLVSDVPPRKDQEALREALLEALGSPASASPLDGLLLDAVCQFGFLK